MSSETEAAAMPAAKPEPARTEPVSPEPAIPEPARAGTAGVALPKEIGGAKGPEPTRYGDWEHKGRCTDF